MTFTPTSLPTIASGQTGRIADTAQAWAAVNALTSATTGAVGKGDLFIDPRDYGAVGNGIANDTTAIVNAFAAANARKVTSGTYADPGATVLLSGNYNLSSLSAPIDMMCNVRSDGATFTIPSSYTGIAVRAGHTTSGNVLRNANIEVPSVIGATRAGPGSLPSGSIGVQVRNLYTSDVKAGNILYFETGIQVGGESHGAAYNRIAFRTISYCKVRLLLKAIDATGWTNQNTYISGSTTGSIAWEGRRNTGSFGVLMDGAGGNTVTGNTFVGTSFESDVYENVIEFRNAYQNQFYGCRHEQGIAATACTLTAASATITSVGHFLSVGDMITFTGSSTPTGMNFDQPYFVVSVPTADTFTVSRARGGTAVTFSTVGTSIAFSRPQRVKYDKSWENVIDLPMGPLKWLDRISVSVVPADTAGNQVRYPSRTTTDAYSPSEWPLHRARNRYTAGSSSQPLWAAYTSTTDPDENPSNWTAALTSKGFNFADGAGAELGWISNSGGVLKYQRLSDSVVYELPSARRTQSGTTLASGTTYNAGTRTSATVTLTGTAAGDYVDISTTTGVIPLGLIIQAQVTAADTITYTVDNLTAANITLGSAVTLWFMASRRFF